MRGRTRSLLERRARLAAIYEAARRPRLLRSYAPPVVLLRPAQARLYLSTRLGRVVPRSTLYRWYSRGSILASRIGALWFVTPAALDVAIARMADGERI